MYSGSIENNKCILCNAVADSLNGPKEFYNTLLYESEHFIVVPCIGPLVKGQIMIVSKEHYHSLASMGSKKISDLKSVFSFLYKKVNFNDSVLIAEHGSGDSQTGGSCIIHTHLHWIPALGHFTSLLEGMLPLIESTNEIDDLLEIQDPYILTIDHNRNVKIYQAYNAHSQMIRKALCAELGRTDWDWSKNPQFTMIKETIEIWKQTTNE